MHHRLQLSALSTLFALAVACGDDSSPDKPSSTDASQVVESDAGNDLFPGCSRGTMEDDFQAAPLMGPGVQNGVLPKGEYLISTTYLQLRQDATAQSKFNDLMQPLVADLMTRSDLVAVSLGTSASCGTARTLSVWRDDAAMMGFVAGPAHRAAMSSVREISRGGSMVTSWLGNEGDATWKVSAEHAGQDDGPQF